MSTELSTENLHKIQQEVIDIAFRFGPKVLVAVSILVIGLLMARWAGRWAGRMFEKIHMEIAVQRLLQRLVRLVVFGLFGVIALQNLGVELLPLLAGLGVAGAGIALAMQGVLGNVVAGLTIVFTKPFKVGEYIAIVGVEGLVEDISTFSTKLSHADMSVVVIPNRKIVGEVLHNYGTIRQLQLSVGVAYDTDIDRALATVREVLAANPRLLTDPAPVVRISQLSESSIDILVRPWAKLADVGLATGEIYKAIVEKLRERGIVIPFPQRDVHLLGPGAAPRA
jgi:small conductance mechanosensitive channel